MTVEINHRFTFAEQGDARSDDDAWEGSMESNQRFYMRRAAEERTAAHRAMTPQARDWHAKLAQDFAERAVHSHNPIAATA